MNKFREYYLSEFKPNKENFGFRVAITNYFLVLIRNGVLPDFHHFFYKVARRLRYEAQKSYMRRNYGYLAKKYISLPPPPQNSIPNDAPIFVLWLQGEENMPPICKMCVASIRRFSASHPVIFLDQNNLKEYIDVPEIVHEKIENGTLAIQYLADLARCLLISKYGGFWLDATVYLTDIPKAFVDYNSSFFSVKSPRRDKQPCLYISAVLGGVKNNLFYALTAEIMSEYAKRENAMLDYFMIDRAVDVGLELLPQIRKQVKDIAINNPNWWYTVEKATSPYDEQRWQEVQKDTSIFKLSYKRKWDGYSDDPDCLCQYLLRNQ